MYLKRIIAHGFKSFADNTIIDLDNNITGIVGPNGSGKSNVVDAVRWVLGEQSIKSLRGDSNMTDVIFAGSKSRSAMNVASVTLVFDNSDHYLKSDEDLISIKRRLYKDGTNEFFINNEKCRLKDILDLLMDSGIARESFNIISQGKIDEILLAKPESRRTIFEEAAGVLKYKKRKEEALKKLDKTHDNMDRINDIISELEKQIEPLREQKIKALNYLSLSDELRELEISLITHDITNINDTYQATKDKIDLLKEDIVKLSTENTTNETKVVSYKNKISSLDDEIKNMQQELLEYTSLTEKINAKKQIILERKKYEVENVKLHELLINLKESELTLKNEINSCNNEINNKNIELKNNDSTIDEYESLIIKIKGDKDTLIDKLNNVIRASSVINTKIDTLKEAIDNNSSLPYSVKKVLDNPKLRGIHNVIGALIETEEIYSKAISTSLSTNSRNVVVDNSECAKEAIKYLKENNIGRVTFFPLNIIKEKYIDMETLNIVKNLDGFIGIASDLVKYLDKYSNIIKNQLGNVLIVRDIDVANKISKLINYKYKVVTLDGEIIYVGGSLTGGNIKIRNIITDKYDLENNIKEYDKLIQDKKNIENEINECDYKLRTFEDKLYICNKNKINIKEYIKSSENKINEGNRKLDEIELQISNINNSLNNTIDEEENKVLKEYYNAASKKDNILSSLELLNNNKMKLQNELSEFEYTIKQENSLYNLKNNELHELEIKVNRADVKLDTLLNTLNETYSMTYEHAKKLFILSTDSTTARNKVNSLKKQIKDLGPVNTMAPEEYEKVSTRYEFLIHQQEDLSNSENTLLEIISEMDTVMKKEFGATFKVIQENFSTTFKELFKGGNAKLTLTDPSNLLETGIEIEACPPGKTLKSISLLSGGEKTFTAISLLFAILKSRKVPFSILDEVEAALDEVNVESFGEYINKLKSKTQFIVITHKKKTMEYVDVLYGITMQESGVSKLVSVKLEELK